jgi:glycine/D-amino acid oxidase-like deaminating enzyme
VRTNDEVSRIEPADEGLRVTSSSGTHATTKVINASYSRLNEVHQRAGVAAVPLQHELTEMALVALPPAFASTGVTIMDGPFFSVMPFPERQLHSLSHVRFTPHYRWLDAAGKHADPHELKHDLPQVTRFAEMYADVLRYMPALAHMRHEDSLWEIKTVLPKSAGDDSRPILFMPDNGIPHFTTVMGGKLDNVYDVLEELSLLYASP